MEGLPSPFLRLCVLRIQPGFLARGSESNTAPLWLEVLLMCSPELGLIQTCQILTQSGVHGAGWRAALATGYCGNGNLEERPGVGQGAVIRGSELAEGTQGSQGCSMLEVNLPTSAEAAIRVSSIQH